MTPRRPTPSPASRRPSRDSGGFEKKGGYPSGQPANPRPPKPPTSSGPGTEPSKPTGK
jgi:hypothetical protein